VTCSAVPLAGGQVSYSYDAEGNKIAMTDATRSSSYVYDPDGERLFSDTGLGHHRLEHLGRCRRAGCSSRAFQLVIQVCKGAPSSRRRRIALPRSSALGRHDGGTNWRDDPRADGPSRPLQPARGVDLPTRHRGARSHHRSRSRCADRPGEAEACCARSTSSGSRTSKCFAHAARTTRLAWRWGSGKNTL